MLWIFKIYIQQYDFLNFIHTNTSLFVDVVVIIFCISHWERKCIYNSNITYIILGYEYACINIYFNSIYVWLKYWPFKLYNLCYRNFIYSIYNNKYI